MAPTKGTKEELLDALAECRRIVQEYQAAQDARVDNEGRYRALFQSGDAVRYLCQADSGAVVDVNEAACSFYGYRREELLARSAWDLNLLPREELLEVMAGIGDGDRPTFRWQHRLKSGEIREVEVFLTPFRENGQRLLCHTVHDVTDIADRRKKEIELRESRDRLQGIFETSPAGILIVDAGGRITFCNRQMADLFGCPMPKLIGSPYLDYLHQDGKEECARMMQQLLSGELDHVVLEKRYLRCDGSSFWAFLSARPVKGEDASSRALIGVISDITERKRMEEAIVESEARYRALVELSPEAIYIFVEGKIVFTNVAGAELLGAARPDQINGRDVLSFVHPEFLTIVGQRALNVEAGRSNPPTELILTRLDGSIVPVEVASAPLTYHGKKAVQAIARDIGERQRTQDELHKVRKLESLGVLAGGIAHDFNNFLTGILGNLSLARLQVDASHSVAKRLEDCEKAALQAGELARQLLTFARGGAPVKKLIYPAPLIRDTVSFALRGSNVRSTVELAPDLWRIEADEAQLGQVLHNLLFNAAQSMPGGGEVAVRAGNQVLEPDNPLQLSPGHYLRLSVEDHGCGIPRENLARIFDPYFTTKSQGTGLGLSSVYSIVKRHGGTVQVDSSIGRGSSFVVYLPASQDVPPEAEDLEKVAQPPGKGRVLVMDDEEFIREILTEILEYLGYEAESCADGLEAVERYRAAYQSGSPFAAVILDLTVPGGMGGKQAAQQLLQIDPGAVLVVSSGYSNDPVLGNFAEHGFSAAIPKPFTSQKLSRELGRLIAEKR